MKSVIIGGTSNLGKYISEKLESLGSEIITISRSAKGIHENSKHFQCDVLDQDRLRNLLHQIKNENDRIDNLWCIAGYAYPTIAKNQTQEIIKRHIDRNFTYVKTTLDVLGGNLARGKDPFVVTLGSQWSYRSPEECPELIPYANAKNALMKYTHKFALENQSIRANHYCIPSSNTFSFRRIEQTLKKIRDKEMVVSHGHLADPNVVTEALVAHALTFKGSGQTFVINNNGLVDLLK